MKLYLEGNTSEVLSNMGKKVLKQYLEALAALSSALGKQLGKYDMYSMIAGMVFVFQVKGFTSSFSEPNKQLWVLQVLTTKPVPLTWNYEEKDYIFMLIPHSLM